MFKDFLVLFPNARPSRQQHGDSRGPRTLMFAARRPSSESQGGRRLYKPIGDASTGLRRYAQKENEPRIAPARRGDKEQVMTCKYKTRNN